MKRKWFRARDFGLWLIWLSFLLIFYFDGFAAAIATVLASACAFARTMVADQYEDCDSDQCDDDSQDYYAADSHQASASDSFFLFWKNGSLAMSR